MVKGHGRQYLNMPGRRAWKKNFSTVIWKPKDSTEK